MYTYMYAKDEQGKGNRSGQENGRHSVDSRGKRAANTEELKTRRNVSAIKVTRHNKPVLAILPWELYESIVETLEILGDEELMADLRQSIQDAAEGKGEPWEAVKRELGWS